MHKLKLDLDALEVSSFEVSNEDTETRGTVEGHVTPIIVSGVLIRGFMLGYQIGQAVS